MARRTAAQDKRLAESRKENEQRVAEEEMRQCTFQPNISTLGGQPSNKASSKAQRERSHEEFRRREAAFLKKKQDMVEQENRALGRDARELSRSRFMSETSRRILEEKSEA